MNKNITKISCAVFSALALILCQFWTCSTAQSINYIADSDNVSIHKQEEQASKGSSILFFKLLTPIVPKNGPQISKTNLSDGHSVDAYTPLVSYNTTYYIAVEFFPLAGNRCYYNNEHSICSLEYAFDIQSRGPPNLMC